MTEELFLRNVPGSRERMSGAVIGIAGCGGLGSNAAVSLIRAGADRLILADHDRVEISNLNRQAFFHSDVGAFKSVALAEHLRGINPEAEIISHVETVTKRNMSELFSEADILIEAFDRAEQKQWLINTWSKTFPDRPIVAGNGIAGIGRTGMLRVTKIGNVYFCGDMASEMEEGLCAPRVAIVANMQAHVVVELLVKGSIDGNG